MSANRATAEEMRAAFSTAMSRMYRDEVPAYGKLIELVAKVNEETLAAAPALEERLRATGSLDRISEERHGAIRLGSAAELSMMRRIFAVMGMYPVGYYDLSTAGIPVHSTAFRPIGEVALKRNPFRVFTSLLRLDLIADQMLRYEAEAIIAERRIFTPSAIALTEKAERQSGLDTSDAQSFVDEVLETFRWHYQANVSIDLYRRLHEVHRLIADIISFKGPHINHLTPRTLDIDKVQVLMPEYGIVPKPVIEGPPLRKCPILLRQTSFKALDEPVSFRDPDGSWKKSSHTARFGEIEQRGIALTPKGRALYDRLLDKVRKVIRPAPEGSNSEAYKNALTTTFAEFPDEWDDMRQAGLAYFDYSLTEKGKSTRISGRPTLDTLIADGLVQFDPIVYEDFLPVSAAGIFQSNLGDGGRQDFTASPNQKRFEVELGAAVLNEFEYYASVETASITSCFAALTMVRAGE